MESLLQIKNVRINKASKGEANLINLELRRGEIHAIMGEPGAGKTGIAHIMAGLQAPGEGGIYLGDRPVADQPVAIKNPYQSLALGIGVLFENSGLSFIPHLTVKEYLYLWTSRWIISNKKMTARAEQLLEEYEIGVNPNHLYASLSQEERRLVSLLRLLARNPSVLVLDEPSADLSEIRKQHLFRILRKYARKQAGILYLSNQLEEVLQIGDWVTILKNSGTLACFPIEYAKRNPEKIVGVYFGREEQEGPGAGSPSAGSPGGGRHLAGDDEFKDVIDILLHTTELLTSEYELQDLLNLLVEKITAAFKADLCSIILFDEASTNVVENFRYLRSNLPEVELKEKIVRDVIKDGRPLIIHAMKEEESLQFFNQQVAIRSLLCMPIPVRTKMNGAIEVFFTQKKNFVQDEIELLKTFATQVAIAIENTRLLGRSTLLKEAHHRIKNNLQSVISLLLLQFQSKSKKSLETIVWNIIDRIQTIADVHEILSRDEKSIGLINFKNLVHLIVTNYHQKDLPKKIQIDVAMPDWYVSYKTASSLGLIVNELLSNCFEHAFPGGKEGLVRIKLEQNDRDMLLQVSDNGIGLSNELLQMQSPSNSLGLYLVRNLVSHDLRGAIQFENRRGAQVRITFPKQPIHY